MAEKLPAANLLLLKRLLSLLQHIGRNAATSRMTPSNLAICVGPNLLSPANEDLLPLEAMLEVAEKVRWTDQPAAALAAHESLAAQRCLGTPPPWSKCWRGGCLQGQPHSRSLVCRSKSQERERLLGPFSGSCLESKALMCAGEGAAGVSDGELQGTLWGGDN